MKVAIVTGASQGIGAGIVEAFRGAGYAVAGTSRTIPMSNERDFLTVPGDIAEPETAERVVDQTLERFGHIDSLINNAGIFVAKPFIDYTVADFSVITGVNLAGFFHVTQRCMRQMVAQGSGHVVNMTTSLVDHAERASASALTSLTKGGLDAVTRALATEYASRGVRVNAVAPGVVRTAEHDPSSYDGLASRHPIGRLGRIDDITDAILYLEQATFVTGETLRVDGGWAAGH